jgi:4'-phosphopantetheinyl transferase
LPDGRAVLVFMFVRYEARMEDVVVLPGPDVVMAWTTAAASERSKLLLATRAAQSLGATGDLTLARHCPRCGSGEHGRPHFAGRHDLAVSLASAEGVTAAAVTRGAPVGVDIEHLDDARFAGIGNVLLHPGENAAGAVELARTWVRKESLLKALGVGLGTDPRAVRLSPATEPPALLAPLPDGRDSGVWIVDLALVPPLIGAVAVLSPQSPQVTTTEVAPEAPAP